MKHLTEHLEHTVPDLAARKKQLGHFEYSVLQAVEALGKDAYGARIGVYLTEKLGRDVTAPQVYMTLERLAKQNLVSSEETDPLPQQGGRRRRRIIVGTEGAWAMARTQAAFSGQPSPTSKERRP